MGSMQEIGRESNSWKMKKVNDEGDIFDVRTPRGMEALGCGKGALRFAFLKYTPLRTRCCHTAKTLTLIWDQSHQLSLSFIYISSPDSL